jgi:hypothetical protein
LRPTEENKGGAPCLYSTKSVAVRGAPQRRLPPRCAGRDGLRHRDASFATVIAGMWEDPKDNQENIAWVRDYYAATAPHSKEGDYINFMAGDDQERVAYNYGASYERLIDIKKEIRCG